MPTHTFQVTPSGAVLHRISTVNYNLAFPSGTDYTPTQAHALDNVVGYGWTGKTLVGVNGLQRLPFTLSQYAAISAATLRLFTTTAPGLASSGEIALIRRDGIWDAVSGVSGWTLAPLLDFSVSVQTSGGVSTIIPVTASAATSRFQTVNRIAPAGSFNGDSLSNTIAQTILMPASGPQDMQRVLWRLNRISSPTGNARVSIFAVTASDGSDDRPTGAALATSNDVAMSTFTTATAGALVVFDFAAPLTLSYNTRYAVVLDVDDTPTFSAYPRALFSVDGDAVTYTSGQASIGTRNKYAFHNIAYAEQEFWPNHRGISGGVRTPEFAKVVREFPITAANAILDLDVTTLIQQWVDAPDYVSGSIAFSFTNLEGATPQVGDQHFWSDAALIVVEGTNHLLSGTISGQAILGPAVAVTHVFGGLLSGQAIFGPPLAVQHAYQGALSGQALLGPLLLLQRGLGATLSGQAILSARLHQCGWFTARASDWFTARSDGWFTARSDGWFDPPEECID